MISYSVRKPYTVIVAVVAVIVIGVMSVLNLTTDLLPAMNLPYAVVMTTYGGASPDEVETVVTRAVESSMATTTDIKSIRSVSSENMSVVILEFNNGANMDTAMIEMREGLDMLEAAWPSGVGTSIIMKINPDILPVVMASVDSEGMEDAALSRLIEDELIPKLESIDGVASVSASGLVENRVEITIDAAKLAALNEKIFASIDESLSSAYEQIDEAKQKLTDGWAQLEETREEQTENLDDAERQIASGRRQLKDALEELETQEATLTDGIAQLKEGVKIAEDTDAELAAAADELTAGIAAIDAQLKEIGDAPTDEQASTALYLTSQKAELEGKLAEVEAGREQARATMESLTPQIAEAEAGLLQINAGKDEINAQLRAVSSQSGKLDDGRETLEEELAKAEEELADGEEQLKDQEEQLTQSEEDAKKSADMTGILTPATVSQIIAAQNISLPAGYVTKDGEQYLVKVGDELTDAEALSGLLLFTSEIEGVERVYLRDVADVEYTKSDGGGYVRVNGNPGIMLSYSKQTQYATPEVAKSIRAEQAALSAEYGVRFSILLDQGVYVDMIVQSVLENLLYGAILAIIVLAVFLRSVKPTLIVACSIPISVIFAVGMMYFSGVNINIISLSGLALGIGMLVDNSIVAIENIYRLRSAGVPAKEAAVKGVKEIAGAITASTLTTVCVFLPIVFTEGISRELFTDMGLTIAYSLVASLAVALTVVPSMGAAIFKKDITKKNGAADKLAGGYAKLLAKTIKRKWAVLAFAVALLAAATWITVNMGLVFMPEIDNSQIRVSIEPDAEATDAELRAMADAVSEAITRIEDVETVGAMEGGGAMSLGGMGTGSSSGSGSGMSMYVILKDERAQSNEQVRAQIQENTKGLPCTVTAEGSNMDMPMLSGSGIQIQISGDDSDTLIELSAQVAEVLRNTEGTSAIDDGTQELTPEVRITVDKEKAMERGLTTAQVYAGIRALLTENDAASIDDSGTKYAVVVKDGAIADITPEDIEELTISAAVNGVPEKVRVGDIATVSEAYGPTSINRSNQRRYVTVSADVADGYNVALVGRTLETELAKLDVPEGYSVELAGENETITQTFNDLILMISLAIVLIYLIMVAQFQSLKSPFIVMFTIPLAFTGGMIAIWLSGLELSVIAMLGFLILCGVVVNNGIVYVDCVNRLIADGAPKRDAVIEAGRLRIRPILMTSLTTILGLTTMAMAVGMGGDMIQPMAVTAIGGLIYSTLLTLFVVPCLYDMFNKDKGTVKRDA